MFLLYAVVFSMVALVVVASVMYTSRDNHDDGTKDAMDALRVMHDHSAVTRNQMIR